MLKSVGMLRFLLFVSEKNGSAVSSLFLVVLFRFSPALIKAFFYSVTPSQLGQ